VIEAMASGVPVVATDIGGPPEIVEEAGCGLTLPPREPETWAAEIGPLLAERSLLSRMGERGREAARSRFGIDRHVERILAAYRAALAAGTPV
jgi:glycosyltransferase involved in cell wall biosynthesis